MKVRWVTVFIVCVLITGCDQAESGKHLFILSGQSNMQLHEPSEAFTPTVEAALGSENVIVVQHALGGLPIHRWYKDWRDPEGRTPSEITPPVTNIKKNPETAALGDYYDALMTMVNAAREGQKIKTISFFWMQGERDAKLGWGSVYEASLLGLIEQLKGDLGRDDVNVVIGRLSDYDIKGERFPDWPLVREIQVRVAEQVGGAWVNTDDLNTGLARNGKDYVDDLHYAAASYPVFGKRMADAAIEMIKKKGM